MSHMLLTVEQAAETLRLHPKTVLRYIREGRLEATRIGKGYRIDRAKLDAFGGMTRGSTDGARDVRATAIIEIPSISAEAAARLATFLGAAAMSGDPATRRLHLDTAFDPVGGSLKIVLIGSPSNAARLLDLIEMHLGLPR